MPKIDFEAKTDRELLLLVAQSCNSTEEHLSKINGRLDKHDTRITHIESMETCEYRPTVAHKLWSNNLFSFGVGSTLFGGVLYAFGSGIGWW